MRTPATLHLRRRFIPALVIVTALVTGIHAQNAQPYAADAERLIKAMDVKTGSVIAEIGAGGGELTIELAKVVGPAGRIYSNELNAARLAAIRKVADGAGLTNVTTVEGKEDVANLPDACCDGIFMRNVYHHFGNPTSMNASLLKALKPGGTLAVIDFTPPPPSDVSENPPGHRGEDNHHGITAATLEKELKAAGFEIVSSATTSREVFVVARRLAAATDEYSSADTGTALMLIPEGYHQSGWSGIDSFGGAIWKDDGPRIDYSVDYYRADGAEYYPQTAKTIWRTSGRTTTGLYELAVDHEAGIIVVTFDRWTTFTATRLKSRRDLAEALNIITTYRFGEFRRPLKAKWDLIALGFPRS